MITGQAETETSHHIFCIQSELCQFHNSTGRRASDNTSPVFISGRNVNLLWYEPSAMAVWMACILVLLQGQLPPDYKDGVALLLQSG